jgi:hypothetical protein
LRAVSYQLSGFSQRLLTTEDTGEHRGNLFATEGTADTEGRRDLHETFD